MVLGPVRHAGPTLDDPDVDDIAPRVVRRPAEAPDRHAAGVGVDRGGQRPYRGGECRQRGDADEHAGHEQGARAVGEVGHDGTGKPDRERADRGQQRDPPAFRGRVQLHPPLYRLISSSTLSANAPADALPAEEIGVATVLQTAGMHRLEGKIALITGAARGTGAAIARKFVAEGARVVLVDVLDDRGESVASELGDAARFERLDVTDEDAWGRTVAGIGEREGALHVLVNNAAVLHLATIDATATEAFERVMRVNVTGPFLGIRTCLPLLRTSGAGAIVNVGSIDSVQGAALTGAYTASKFALRGLTKVVALENRKRGVRANIVCPMLGNPEMHPEIVGTDSGPMPVGNGTPPDLAVIAEAVCYFASDESRFATGTELVLDGGHSVGLALDLPDAWFDPQLRNAEKSPRKKS